MCIKLKRLIGLLLSVALVLSLVNGMSFVALADGSQDATWSSDQEITGNTDLGKVTVDADLTLTIAEGATLTVSKGIDATGYTLTVTGKGMLIVTGESGESGRDGEDGSNSSDPFGNGGNGSNGGEGKNGGIGLIGNLIVDGASVTVTGGVGGTGGNGGSGGSSSSGGDGGAGGNGSNGGKGGDGISGNVTLNCGSLNAIGGNGGIGGSGGSGGNNSYMGSSGAGGNGSHGGIGGDGISGNVNMKSGSLTATGGNGGNGNIGGKGGRGDNYVSGKGGDGGSGNEGGNGVNGSVIVSGGSTTVTGGNGGTGGAGGAAGDSSTKQYGGNGGTGGAGGAGIYTTNGYLTINSGSVEVKGGNGVDGGVGGKGGTGTSITGGSGGDGGAGGTGVKGSVDFASGILVTAEGGKCGNGGKGGECTTIWGSGSSVTGSAGNIGRAVTGAITGSADESDDKINWTAISGGSSEKRYVRSELPPEPVSYLDWDETTQTFVEKTGDDACADYTVVESDGYIAEWESGWYVVPKDSTVIFDNLVYYQGDVHLILCDGAKLKLNAGIQHNDIYADEETSLIIYAQSAGEQAGTMEVKCDGWGIYGGKGAVTVNGGRIMINSRGTAILTMSRNDDQKTGFTVRGGKVEAISESLGIDASEGDVVITGGEVSVTAGLGNGICAANVFISGGDVISTTGDNGYGIAASNVFITDGKLTAASGYSAICGSVKNVMIGTGWTDKEGTGDGTVIAPDSTGQNLYDYKKVQFPGIVQYDLWVGGDRVTENNLSGEGWSYDAENKTLTLDNYSYEGKGHTWIDKNENAHSAGICAEQDLTIKIKNTNTVINSYTEGKYFYGVYVIGDLTITGAGKLKTTSKEEAIYVHNGDITINSGTVETGGYTGIHCYSSESVNKGNITINGGTITATGDGFAGISLYNNLVIKGGIVIATGHSRGIAVLMGDLIVFDGTVEATGYHSSSYGIYVSHKNVIIEGGKVTAVGITQGINCNVKNTIAGIGWEDAAGTTGKKTIGLSDERGQELTYKKVKFANHTHDFTYTADGATITATCANTDGMCPLNDGTEQHNTAISLTVVAPTLKTYGQTGKGISKAASLTGLDDFKAATGLEIKTGSIKYYKAKKKGSAYTKTGSKLSKAPTGAGYYVAELELSGVKTDAGDSGKVTASVGYTISKAKPITNAPTGLSAVYGQTLADVTLTNPAGNTAGTWGWADDATTGVGAVGSHTFKANFTPDDTANYKSMSNVDVTVTVEKAESSGEVTAVSGLVYDGTVKELVKAVSVEGGSFMYRLGTDGEWTESIPEATAFDIYTVYYYIKGDGNHKDTGSKTSPMGSVNVTIKCPYSHEWVAGKWYEKNGTQTYEYTGGWKKDGNDWMFTDTSGWYAKNRWQKIDGKWYFFDQKGHMTKDIYQKGEDGRIWYVGKNGIWDGKTAVIGWKQDSKGLWFVLYGNEYLKNTWKMINGQWYYFKANGYAARNEFVKGYWFNDNCTQTDPKIYSWHKTEKGWWYGVTGGWYAKNATYIIDGKSYTFDKNGYMK